MPLAIGSRLGSYEIRRQLGAGGMGEIYAAEDLRLHRLIALKCLPRAMADDSDRRARFEREAHAVAALNHPNIVTIHSIELDDDVPFLTMELVEGQRRRRRPHPAHQGCVSPQSAVVSGRIQSFLY
jgi:eukaryotic-like serine/threonine-protein kinase